MRSQLFVLALVAVMIAPAFAQDDAAKKKGKGKKKGEAAVAQTASAQLLAQLKDVGLTEEQTAKVKELGKKYDDEIKKIETGAKLTPELLKKRREVTASMKDSELKAKEKAKAIDDAAGLNAEQSEALAKANALRQKMKTEVLKLLSDEQKEKLPAQMKNAGGKGEKGGNAKKKKAA